MDLSGYLEIEKVLQKRKAQKESVRDKDTPFRVEFRFRRGTVHYQYFTTFENAEKAEDRACRYSPWGHAIIERPTSQQIQIRGPRGGWKKFKGACNAVSS